MVGKTLKYSMLASFVILFGFVPDANAQMTMKLRSPIRTWAGESPDACVCPYDQIAWADYPSQPLMFAGYIEYCGDRSAWSRPGGYEPACFLEDMPTSTGQKQQRDIEQVCQQNSQSCYVDIFDRF